MHFFLRRLAEFRQMLSSETIDLERLRSLCFQGRCVLHLVHVTVQSYGSMHALIAISLCVAQPTFIQDVQTRKESEQHAGRYIAVLGCNALSELATI